MSESVTIELPDEFLELCQRYEQSPESVLRNFIADATGIISDYDKPRPDGYSSQGSDEREIAQAYLERAYGTGD